MAVKLMRNESALVKESTPAVICPSCDSSENVIENQPFTDNHGNYINQDYYCTDCDIYFDSETDESLTESPEQKIDTYLGIIHGSIRKAMREYDRTGSLFELRRELFSIKDHATKALKVVDALDLERHSEDQ